MVNFSKQFEAQMIPEWKEVFVDYGLLKETIRKTRLLINRDADKRESEKTGFSGRFRSCLRKFALLEHKQTVHSLIRVHRNPTSPVGEGDLYVDVVKDIFACLDDQLSKANRFYRRKESEFLERGGSLKEQLAILVELRTAVKEERAAGGCSFQELKEEDSISGTVSFGNEDDESIRKRTEAEQCTENSADKLSSGQAEFSDSPSSGELQKPVSTTNGTTTKNLAGSISVRGKKLRIHIPITNPSRTLSAISYLLWDDVINQSSKKSEEKKLHINRRKLSHAEKMIREAFIELYKGLGYLETYRNLNMLALVKILKKFDKVMITNKQVLDVYMKVVETSYFNTSDKALKLGDEMEQLFVKHFAGDDRRRGMKYLVMPPTHPTESHSLTFFIGLFTGGFMALLVGYIIAAHTTRLYRTKSNTMYMETVFPVLSMLSLLFLHVFLYGCNIVTWRKARINYSFILELSRSSGLKHGDVFLICAASMAAVVGVVFVHLLLVAKEYTYAQVQAIPGFLLLGFILVLVCPFNTIYKSSRYGFLRVMRNIILSPFYKVVMLDFFMADQLCSQVPMLRELEYVACYYLTGSYKTQDYGYCMSSTYYRDLAYAASFLPYYWRAMQCVRRWFDEGHKSHLVNLGKYVSAMLAAGAKVAYEKEKSPAWLFGVVVVSSWATLYNLYWDFVKDWGLLQLHSKNPWLRDELMLSTKSIYYFSMGLNLVLRLAWLQTVFHYNFEKVDYRVTMLFLAALEVVRRGQWNFYRLENEHLNNAGKFRAVKTVPLPFHEVDD